MIYDALDRMTFPTGASGSTPTADSYGSTLTSTNPTNPLDTGGGGVGYTVPMFITARYTAVANTTGANALQMNVQTSEDGTTWFDRAAGGAEAVNLTATAVSGQMSVAISVRSRYIRANFVLSGSGTGATATITRVDLTENNF